MKYTKYITACLVGMLAFPFVSSLQADWTKVVDFEDYDQLGCEECLTDLGWTFQDWDYFGYVECVNGANDCTGVRQVVDAPYGGNGQAIEVRGGSPDESLVANSRSVTAVDLPEEIPAGSVATFYMRIAVERLEISTHFGLTQNTEPTNDSAPGVTHNYGDLGTTTAIQLASGNEYIMVYDGWWKASTEDDSKQFETETWYELWYLIQNNTLADGGGLFDLYVRGGPYEEITHIVNPYLAQVAVDAGITGWQFRNNIGEALKRFLVVTPVGNPAADYSGTGAIYFDDMWMNVGEMTTEQPPINTGGNGGGGDSVWDEVSTWLGGIDGSQAPNIWTNGLGWLTSSSASADSVMFYSNGDLGFFWSAEGVYPWFWSFDQNGWFYYYEGTGDGSGAWFYDFNAGQNAWIVN